MSEQAHNCVSFPLLSRIEEASAELAWVLRNSAIDVQLREKLYRLCCNILEQKRVAVAFSAGVDSTLLLAVAHRLLGDACVALTAQSPLIPQVEVREAAELCEQQGIRHVVMPFDALRMECMQHNSPERCYECKYTLMSKLQNIAALLGCLQVIEGSHIDDNADHRPGARALQELHIDSPLKEAAFTKNDIRILSRVLKLSTADKPTQACLASRIPHGEAVTLHKLAVIEAAENILRKKGFHQVRVRVHEVQGGEALMARIEVDMRDIAACADERMAACIYDELRTCGFAYVALDLGGYNQGKLNAACANGGNVKRVVEEL